MSTVAELAAKLAGEDQIARAREMIGNSAVLKARLDSFLESAPTRGQMLDFLASLRKDAAEEQFRQKIDSICRLIGIEHPTGADRLMAMQIGLLQEQNEALARLTNRTGQLVEQSKQQPSIFGPVLAAILIGKAL